MLPCLLPPYKLTQVKCLHRKIFRVVSALIKGLYFKSLVIWGLLQYVTVFVSSPYIDSSKMLFDKY